MAFLSGSLYRKKLTFDQDLIPSNQNDFRVLVTLTNSNFDFSKSYSDGTDIRFTADDGTTELKFDREYHDDTDEEGYYFVRIPSVVSGSGNTNEFYIYYGGDGLSDAADPENTWKASQSANPDYNAVWHMKESLNGTIGELEDVLSQDTYVAESLNTSNASADSEYDVSYSADKAVDDDTNTFWASDDSDSPHWLMYDFGSGNSKVIAKTAITPWGDSYGYGVKDFTVQGSNDASNWDNLYSDQHADNDTRVEYTFTNLTAYRYYRLYFSNTWRTDYSKQDVKEWELFSLDQGLDGQGAGSSIPVQVDGIIYKGNQGQGSSSYVTVPDSSDFYLSGDFTIEWKMKWISSVSNGSILGQSEGGGANKKWFINYGSLVGGRLTFLFYLTGTQQVHFVWTPSADTDYHCMLTREGNNFKFYVNGSQIGGTQTNSNALPDCDSPFIIFSEGESWQWFSGLLDEIRLINGTSKSENYASLAYESDRNNLLTFGSEEEAPIIDNEDAFELTEILEMKVSKEIIDLSESLELDDNATLKPSVEFIDLSETLELDNVKTISPVNEVNLASRIISFNPLIIISDTDPVELVRVDVSDPANPNWSIYTISDLSVKNAKDIYYDETEEMIYIACAEGQILKVDKSDFATRTQIDTGDTDDLTNIDGIHTLAKIFASTNSTTGEIIALDNRTTSILNTDARAIIQVEDILTVRANAVIGAILSTDARAIAQVNTILKTDARAYYVPADKPQTYTGINLNPTAQTDFHVYIDDVELTDSDLKVDSIIIDHVIDDNSTANFVLTRRHDDLNTDFAGNSVEITNQNSVKIYIGSRLEFSGNISNLECNSETETVQVNAIADEKTSNSKTIGVPLSSLNADAHLYDAFLLNPVIDNPIIASDDENPEYYKGIRVDLGVEKKESLRRIRYMGLTSILAEKFQDGTFKPSQNDTYFWFGKGENVTTGQTLTTLRYVGTSFSGFNGDLWVLTGASYRTQREFDNIETDLGYYTVGSAPYNDISVKNGKYIPKDKYEDRTDGLYRVREAGYDFTSYAQQVADIEYDKLKNINGTLFPKTSAIIQLSVDGYLYYDPSLSTRINITNTTSADIYKNNNGFPVAVKSININSETMRVTLKTDNNLSVAELDALDAQLPDETSDEFVFESDEARLFTKFDPNSYKTVE